MGRIETFAKQAEWTCLTESTELAMVTYEMSISRPRQPSVLCLRGHPNLSVKQTKVISRNGEIIKMLSKCSFLKRSKNKTLNELCEQYCKCIVCTFWINECLRKDPDWLYKNTNSNDIKEETFLQLIKRSSSILIGWSFTKAVVDIVDESCITDAVFNELIMISNRDIHDNMCIALSHKHLPESMLIKLCETQLCHESFYELASLCYTDPNISCASFIDSINRLLDGKFCEDFTYLLQELDNLNASEVSKELALKQMKSLYNASMHISIET